MSRFMLLAVVGVFIGGSPAAWAQTKYALVDCDQDSSHCLEITVNVTTPKDANRDCAIKVDPDPAHTSSGQREAIRTIRWKIKDTDSSSGTVWAFGRENGGWGQSFVENPPNDPNELNGREFPVRLRHDAASDYESQMRGSDSLGRPVRDWTVKKNFEYLLRIHYWPKSHPSNKKNCKGTWPQSRPGGDSSTDSGPFYVNRD